MGNNSRKFWIYLLVLALMIQTAACTNNNNSNKQSINRAGNENRLRSMDFSPIDARIPLITQGGEQYFAIQDLLNVVGYQSNWNPETNTLDIGFIDALYKLKLNSTRAEKEEEEIQLARSPLLIKEKMYVPVSVLSDLFQQDIHYKVQAQEVIVHATSTDQLDVDSQEEPAAGVEPFFQDDFDDPFKGEDPTPDAVENTADQSVWSSVDKDVSIPAAMGNIDMNALIRTSKRYLGVPYKFGAKPYPVSKKFDCSTYTQYVFDKYGVNLRRVSRNQARQGIYVSRKKLRKGDLVFFSVPGRFKSNKIVGHVGIYIGSGKMINTFSNRDGVHITNVNRGYWASKYITARRVAN